MLVSDVVQLYVLCLTGWKLQYSCVINAFRNKFDHCSFLNDNDWQVYILNHSQAEHLNVCKLVRKVDVASSVSPQSFDDEGDSDSQLR